MSQPSVRRPLVRACGLAVALLAALAPDAAAQGKDKKKRDADVARYVKQLDDQFTAWDQNGDGVLDKDELARAYRGKDAKPYDFAEPKDPPAKPTVRALVAALATFPQPGLPASLVAGDVLTRSDAKKAEDARLTPGVAPPEVYQGFPDYQFILLAGTKGQTKISRQDFDAWARGYATAVESREEAQRLLLAAQARFAKAKGVKAKKQAEMEVNRHQQELADALIQVNLVPPTVQRALPLKQ